MRLEKVSMGIGDRFGRQGKAQLGALMRAKDAGRLVVPVWNKSHREHTIIGTTPNDVRLEADRAVTALGWDRSYYVDADHIGLSNVNLFMESSDFFTLDVADWTGKEAPQEEIEGFVGKHEDLLGTLELEGLSEPLIVDKEGLLATAGQYLLAAQEAGKIYRHIAEKKGEDAFIAEVSMDETEDPQTPMELLLILAMLAEEGIPAQTIAPKFTGRFNKGVDYVGDVEEFAKEFREDVAVIVHARDRFELPSNLKLSVHSGSDKFSLYAPMSEALRDFDEGLHLKTAGTTWLEELIGLALSGSEGLSLARKVYEEAMGRFEELCAPYAPVIDIDPDRLPSVGEVQSWTGEEYANALRHDPSSSSYNLHFRQMLHISYKVAAEMGSRYLDALDEFEGTIAENVGGNLFERHLKPILGL